MAKFDVYFRNRKGGYLLGLNRKFEAVKSGGPDRNMLSKHTAGASLRKVRLNMKRLVVKTTKEHKIRITPGPPP